MEEIMTNKDIPVIEQFNLENRRYIGSKAKISQWIKNLMEENTTGETLFDVFAGTGIISKELLDRYNHIIINDFLYSNNIIYKAFFSNESYDEKKLDLKCEEFNQIKSNSLDDDYFVNNYGNKFFSQKDCRIIGEIRERIERDKELNEKERAILITSLMYSADKIANTVGHYDAYRKKIDLKDRFEFKLIKPLDTQGKKIEIYREDANKLVKEVKSDVAFIDPPYNSRQYERFYHLLEGIAKWDKPELSGVAMKPEPENISEYCKVSAPQVFDDLISNLDTKYIVVTYNNTYNSKSNSSRNKITHDQILDSLNKVGTTKVFEKDYRFFNAGKTDLKGHKEFVFITEVR